MAEYIIVEKMGGAEYAIVCTDENGENIIFYNMNDAQEYADHECQDAIVLEID